MKKYSSLFLFFIVLVFSCSPWRSFEKTARPLPAPAYADENYWIALPWRHDVGDTIPPGCSIPEDQKNAKVDVFYVHPTVYLSGKNWNGNLSNERLNKKADRCVQFQGSIFNACGRLFAPRYRQAHLHSFFDTIAGRKPLEFAYADVKAAFEYYLKNWNKGRPIILVGHSQGARHVIQLLKDFFDGTPLQQQLVVAYPIGMPIIKEEFKHIPLGESATQTNCFVTWNTVIAGTESNVRKSAYKGAACVNPLTWKTNEEFVSNDNNTGGLPFSFKQIDNHVCDAQVHNGLLWVNSPVVHGYPRIGFSYHLCDCNLFYMNIRQNAKDRVAAYLSKFN